MAPMVSTAPANGPTYAQAEKIDLRGVQFQRDGSIHPASKPVLDSAIELLKDKPDATIFVDAYCDPSGGAKLNRELSEKRAEAVASYFDEHGIPRATGSSRWSEPFCREQCDQFGPFTEQAYRAGHTTQRRLIPGDPSLSRAIYIVSAVGIQKEFRSSGRPGWVI